MTSPSRRTSPRPSPPGSRRCAPDRSTSDHTTVHRATEHTMTESTHAAPGGVATRTTRDLTKAAVSGWLGTAMEFMDFQLYSLAAAIVFNKIFFPNVSPAIGLIAAMATYGVGYVARLAGAIYFGRMGDRIGRKKVLFLTIALMGASTTLIGVLPTYAMIGIAAPILLVVLRLVQGFGAGAEIAGATVMLAEYAPVKRRGVIASLVSLGTNSGTLAASALWAFLLGGADRGAVAQLGLAPAVPAQLHPVDLRGVAADEPQGEPGLRGAARRRRRRRAVPPRGRAEGGRDARKRARGRSEAAQGQGVLPGAGPAVRPGGQLRSRADLPRGLHRHDADGEPDRADPGHRLGVAARLHHRPRGRVPR